MADSSPQTSLAQITHQLQENHAVLQCDPQSLRVALEDANRRLKKTEEELRVLATKFRDIVKMVTEAAQFAADIAARVSLDKGPVGAGGMQSRAQAPTRAKL
ncbi:hypothetical protein AAF712_006246 [Marasmius tenuissimus]|uniref:Uncharacterized protein n=1 Tax=Marasmius tenuissimus TaxID=585030 RepID=A0ABR3A010_9AGAR